MPSCGAQLFRLRLAVCDTHVIPTRRPEPTTGRLWAYRRIGWSVLNGASFCAHSTCTTPLKPQRPLARSCPASRALHFLDHLRSKLTYRRDPRTSGIWSGKRPRHLSAFELASLPYCQSRRPRTIRQTVSLTGASSATFPRRMNIAVRPASVQSGASAASSTGCTNTYTGLPPVPAVP